MPNRIVKESICTSENINVLSVEAETFFYRLMVQCDDYGRMDARPSVLRARCFPLRLNAIDDDQVTGWMDELASADLLWVYKNDGRPYLQVTTWDKHQQKRAKHSKFPQPPERASNGNHLISDASNNDENTEEIVGSHLISIASNSPREARNENTRNESREERVNAPKAVLEGLSEAAKEYFSIFKRKRWANAEQQAEFEKAEGEVGAAVMLRAVKWAGGNNIVKVPAICTAARKMAKGGPALAPPANGKPNDNGMKGWN